jgi:glutathione S-transferase
MLTLYQYPGAAGLTSVSPPCVKIEMALKLLGAEYRVESISSPPAVKRISATGRLPVMDIGGERVPDSIMILDRLEKEFPDARLWPNDPGRHLQDRLWDHVVTDSIYWLGFYMRWVDPDGAPRTYQALFGRRPWLMRTAIRMTFLPRQRRRAGLHGVGGKTPEAVRSECRRAFDMVMEGLGGGPFMQGRDHPGRGDLAATALLSQVGFRDSLPELMQMVRDRPPLVELCCRVHDACDMEGPKWLRGES